MSNVVDLGDGFAFESKKNGRQEFRDEQFINLVLSYKPEHLQGRQTGRVRNDAGKPLPGKGFKLDKNALTVGSPGKESVIPIDQLDAIAIVDNKLSIWKSGEDAPVFSRPFTDKYVYPLSLALDGRIPNRKTDVTTDLFSNTAEGSLAASSLGPASGSEPGLGRIIFERKTPMVEFVLLWFCVGLLFVFGILIIGNGDFGYLVCFALSGVLALYIYFLHGKVLECRERGVVKKTMFRAKELRYDQLESFKFGKTVYQGQDFGGSVLGFKIDLKFKAKPEFNGGSTISYKNKIKVEDDLLESFCAQVSAILAEGMFEELKTTGKVAWTKSLELRAQGLKYRKRKGSGGLKEPILIPYENILKYDFNDGRFLIWLKEKPKSVTIAEQVSQENFFPGFAVFQSMVPSTVSNDHRST